MEKIDTSFLGTGWSFPPTFNLGSRDVTMVSDEEDIHQSLNLLLGTNLGERFLQPLYGCDLRPYTFERISTTLGTQISDIVRKAILYNEPRINIEDIKVNHDDLNGIHEINVEYHVISTNTRNNFVYPYYLNEGTDL